MKMRKKNYLYNFTIIIYNMDLYYDRNMKDKIIGPTLLSIEKYFNDNKLNVNKEWGYLKKTSEINFHWGIKCKFKDNTFFRDILMNKYKYNIIIEQGFLNRKYYRSFGINGFAGFSKIKPVNCPKDRFEKLNIKIKDIDIKNDGYILFCAQLPWDTQVQEIDYNKYINKKCCPLCEGKNLSELNGSDIKTLIKQKKLFKINEKYLQFNSQKNFPLQHS